VDGFLAWGGMNVERFWPGACHLMDFLIRGNATLNPFSEMTIPRAVKEPQMMSSNTPVRRMWPSVLWPPTVSGFDACVISQHGDLPS
jgi:hypothetical protein